MTNRTRIRKPAQPKAEQVEVPEAKGERLAGQAVNGAFAGAVRAVVDWAIRALTDH
ncbi:hypothetical protein [Streptomyces globosus]|uniref:hypothetical protein n=1 Tax=Streptomyces globosus TaxID=68209 RepID=UPI0013B38E00|nr:hypothetical protein [Streptomyces globosus]